MIVSSEVFHRSARSLTPDEDTTNCNTGNGITNWKYLDNNINFILPQSSLRVIDTNKIAWELLQVILNVTEKT